jgi:hypothetical protein
LVDADIGLGGRFGFGGEEVDRGGVQIWGLNRWRSLVKALGRLGLDGNRSDPGRRRRVCGSSSNALFLGSCGSWRQLCPIDVREVPERSSAGTQSEGSEGGLAATFVVLQEEG